MLYFSCSGFYDTQGHSRLPASGEVHSQRLHHRMLQFCVECQSLLFFCCEIKYVCYTSNVLCLGYRNTQNQSITW